MRSLCLDGYERRQAIVDDLHSVLESLPELMGVGGSEPVYAAGTGELIVSGRLAEVVGHVSVLDLCTTWITITTSQADAVVDRVVVHDHEDRDLVGV
jgi:hypothetical protein